VLNKSDNCTFGAILSPLLMIVYLNVRILSGFKPSRGISTSAPIQRSGRPKRMSPFQFPKILSIPMNQLRPTTFVLTTFMILAAAYASPVSTTTSPSFPEALLSPVKAITSILFVTLALLSFFTLSVPPESPGKPELTDPSL